MKVFLLPSRFKMADVLWVFLGVTIKTLADSLEIWILYLNNLITFLNLVQSNRSRRKKSNLQLFVHYKYEKQRKKACTMEVRWNMGKSMATKTQLTWKENRGILPALVQTIMYALPAGPASTDISVKFETYGRINKLSVQSFV